MVARAKGYCDDVEFSPMDATRSVPEYVYRMLTEVIDAGATTINIPDTVGYAIPEEFQQFIEDIKANVPNIDKATHLRALPQRPGARRREQPRRGAGGRAADRGVRQRHRRAGGQRLARRGRDVDRDAAGLLPPLDTDLDTTQIHRTSRLVSQLTGMVVQPNKSIVGVNAFRHQSGIHQHGVTKMRETYEIIDPADIGLPKATQLVLNKNSGRHGLKSRLDDLGYELTTDELDHLFMAFKDLADKKGEIDDRDLDALVSGERRAVEDVYKLDLLQVSCGNQLDPDGDRAHHRPRRQGAPDAPRPAPAPSTPPSRRSTCSSACPNQLLEYAVNSVTEGIDAQGEVTVRIDVGGRTFVGRSADTDIVVASAKALMNALNRAIAYMPAHAREEQVLSNP